MLKTTKSWEMSTYKGLCRIKNDIDVKVEFITHGLESTEKTVNDYLNESFEDIDFVEFHGISAFTRKSGLNKFKQSLLENKERFKKITFTLGIVPRGTTVEALEFFIKNNIECYTYLNELNMLHSKIYYFKGSRFSRFIIGSSNLTAAGLANNIESSVVIEFKSGDRKGSKFIKQYNKHFESITKNYSDVFVRLTPLLIKQLTDDNIIFPEYYKNNFEEFEKNTAKKIRRAKKKYKSQYKHENTIIEENFNSSNSQSTSNLLSERYLKNWDKYFKLYQQYVKDNNRSIVSKHTRISGLINWYFKQKKLHRENLLPQRHYKLLEELNFPFEDAHKRTYDRAFLARANEFKAYVDKFKTNQIPRTRDKNNPYKSLSDWVALTRSDFNLGKLNDERIKILKGIDFPFEAKIKGRNREDDSWMDKYFQLMEYKRINGHCNAPQFNEDGVKNEVGAFVNEQRILGTKGRMKYPSKIRIFIEPIRKELLDDLGFEWNYELNKHKRNFMKRIEEWRVIKAKHPDLVFPPKTFMRERQWRAEMRSQFTKLPEYKQKILIEEKVV